MPKCVICEKEVSKGSFSMKDKYELSGGGFICKTCAGKVGINGFMAAGMTTANKVRKKYFDMYPEEAPVRKGDFEVDNAYAAKLYLEGKKIEACQYVKQTANLSDKEATKYLEKTIEDISCQFFDKVNSIPNCRAIGLGAKYLWTVLNDGEEVLHMVSCLMRKDSFALFNSQNVVKSSNSSSDIWAVALTDTRIVMFNKHLLVGSDCISLPLESVKSITFHIGLAESTITIMHGDSGVVLERVKKGYEKPFVDKANEAIQKARAASASTIGGCQSNNSAFSVADELSKLKALLDQGILTQEEFDAQKAKLLKQ